MTFTIKVRCIADEETRKHNTALSNGYPEPTGTGRLAVVGGGPSLLETLPRLREWEGDIWGVNQTAAFLEENGIPAIFYTVCPAPGIEPMIGTGDTAVIADHCPPSLYEALKGRKIYRIMDAFYGPGPTSAVAATKAATRAGYDGVSFFGCDSSYSLEGPGTSHVYRDEQVIGLMRVKCGPKEYLTKPEFILQAQELSALIRKFPERFSDESGGLLSAMIQHKDFEVTAVHKDMVIERV